jgi:hypothetical protein
MILSVHSHGVCTGMGDCRIAGHTQQLFYPQAGIDFPPVPLSSDLPLPRPARQMS